MNTDPLTVNSKGVSRSTFDVPIARIREGVNEIEALGRVTAEPLGLITTPSTEMAKGTAANI